MQRAWILSIVLLFGAPAVAQPELRLSVVNDGDLLASWQLDPIDGEPAAWNLYRGDLATVGFGAHRGSPQGRCSLPADSREVLLPGQAALRANFYYLLSSFDDTPVERDVGFESGGAPRRHDHPCSYQSSCPAGGRALNPAANWALLHGSIPPEQLSLPVFTARNMDGSVRDEMDLFGQPTLTWFYPAAGTGG